MKRALLLIFTGMLLLACGSAKNIVTADKAPIIASIDLVNVNDDRVLVSIDPALFTEDAISFYIPKIVPGTYSQDNYGKYIDDLKALDYNGQLLAVIRKDDDSWFIENGKKLDRITYYVNDTFDTESEVDNPVFSPAGTNIFKKRKLPLKPSWIYWLFQGIHGSSVRAEDISARCFATRYFFKRKSEQYIAK